MLSYDRSRKKKRGEQIKTADTGRYAIEIKKTA
jgi:hypothetical protein